MIDLGANVSHDLECLARCCWGCVLHDDPRNAVDGTDLDPLNDLWDTFEDLIDQVALATDSQRPVPWNHR